jgi:hypothetical protein
MPDGNAPMENEAQAGLQGGNAVLPAPPPPPAASPAKAKSRIKPPARTALQPDFVPPDEWRDYALAKHLTEIEAGQEWGKFRDHHLAKATKFADWNAAWRNWIRNAIEFKQRREERERGRFQR